MKGVRFIGQGFMLKVLVLYTVLCSYSLSAQVDVSVDTTLIRIGEEIKYTIQVSSDTTDLVLFPEGQSFMPLEMIESYKADTTREGARYRLIKRYGLTQFDSGGYTIPPQKIVVNDKVFSTDSIKIEVRDVPVDTTKQKMFEIKPALEVDRLPFNFKTLLYWLVPLLLIAGLGYYFFRRKKRKEAKEQELPPYEEALVSLRKLDEAQLLRPGKSKAYYSQLTEIVKRYLDREVDDTALESTSDELIQRLNLIKDAGHVDLDGETIKRLDGILKRADLVKFAKMELAEVQTSADRNAVEEIITATHDAIPEPTEEELLLNELYAEEQRKKRRRKRLMYAGLGVVLVLLISTVVVGSVYGWAALKDNVLGHPTKDLAEGRWYKSEYGIPAVILESPMVLKRREVEIPAEYRAQFKSMNFFAYGSILDHFYLVVNTNEFAQPTEVNLEQALEGMLQSFEQQGAKNLIVKRESFETDKGVKGVKAYGSFDSDNPLSSKDDTQQYQLLLFGQAGALQQVIIAYLDSDPYAKEMVDRILNSIELEVQAPTGLPPKKEEE